MPTIRLGGEVGAVRRTAAGAARPRGCAAARSRWARSRPGPSRAGGDGTPTVLLHGWLDNADTWLAVLDRLSVAGRPAIAYDLPGFGTAPPLALGLGARPARRLRRRRGRARRRALGPRVVVAGNSLGGWVALRLAQIPICRSPEWSRSARPGFRWRRRSSPSTGSRPCRGSSGCRRRCRRRSCARWRAASTGGSRSPSRRRSTSVWSTASRAFTSSGRVIRERIEYAKRLRDGARRALRRRRDQGAGERDLGRGRPPLCPGDGAAQLAEARAARADRDAPRRRPHAAGRGARRRRRRDRRAGG